MAHKEAQEKTRSVLSWGVTRRFAGWGGEVYSSCAIRHCADEGSAIQGRAFLTGRARPHSPGETVDNSPSFQRWDRRRFIILPSPGGTTETLSEKAFQPSLRDWTGRAGRGFPPLKCWAIVRCPSGTRALSISCRSAGCTRCPARGLFSLESDMGAGYTRGVLGAISKKAGGQGGVVWRFRGECLGGPDWR